MKNTLVTIGYMGRRTAYLNVSVEEAIVRYAKESSESLEEVIKWDVCEFAFDDSFEVYDACPLDRHDEDTSLSQEKLDAIVEKLRKEEV